MLSATDPNGYTTAVGYDGLGRLVFVAPPAVDGCTAGRPTTRIAYELTADPASEPVSVVRTFTELACSALGADVLEAKSYVDGLGRVRASLSESEHAGEWIQTGVMLYTARGTAYRAYQPARAVPMSATGWRGLFCAWSSRHQAERPCFSAPRRCQRRAAAYVSVVMDQALGWDAARNLRQIRDDRGRRACSLAASGQLLDYGRVEAPRAVRRRCDAGRPRGESARRAIPVPDSTVP